MGHSKNFKKVKKYYKSGNWTLDMVKNAVVKGWITPIEFEEITNQPYEEGENVSQDLQ